MGSKVNWQYSLYQELYPQEKEESHYSFYFLLVVLVLTLLGLITLYSASYWEATRHNLEPYYYFLRQFIFAFIGLSLFLVARFIPMRLFQSLSLTLLIISFGFMLLTIVGPFGVERFGAKRWLQVGPIPSFQPSELLKFATLLYFSHLFSQHTEPTQKILLSVGVIALGSAFLLLQKDYSSMLLYLGVSVIMLILGGVPLKYMLLALFALPLPLATFLLIEPYRIKRIVSFLFPSLDPSGLNWQVSTSLEAIRSGGLFGKGIGSGVYKLGVIPEVHSDFIFASYIEESGFFGLIIFIALYGGLTYFGLKTALRYKQNNQMFAYLLSSGITLSITIQALMNIAVVTSLLPPTGIPLPFFSQGGTNLLVVLGQCALLYSLMVNIEKEM
ncbi:MAG: FtsW/RodA/SpoVE family cell cycle protein [Sphaerochaetaceae bacterium]|jgi:cell division protein FtsW